MASSIGFSVLTDHATVRAVADKYPSLLVPPELAGLVPEQFDGRDYWFLYIRPPSNVRQAPSFAVVAKDVLNDRFTLQSGGQIEFDLDHFEVLACKTSPPLPVDPKAPSSTYLSTAAAMSADGASIYDAWAFSYGRGFSQLNCFSWDQLAELNKPRPESVAFDQRMQLYGMTCQNGGETCLTQFKNTPIAKRLFLSSAIYNVTHPGMTPAQKIANIKYDLCKWGPLAAGFLVYENFLEPAYRGTTVYENPQGRVLGGHYVSIVGWRKDYWICRNSWGADWGLMGFFKIRMGTAQIEDNVSAVMPFLPYATDAMARVNGWRNGAAVSLTDMATFNPDLYRQRQSLQLDPQLFYTRNTLDAIQKGKVYGSLTPLIPYPHLLPNPSKFWVMDILNFTFVNLEESGSGEMSRRTVVTNSMINALVVWTFLVLGVAIFSWK